jgi:hypothetical protein
MMKGSERTVERESGLLSMADQGLSRGGSCEREKANAVRNGHFSAAIK